MLYHTAIMKHKLLTAIIVALLTPFPLQAAPVLPLNLMESRPHDASLYTQGLFFFQESLFESAGLYGKSSISRWSFEKGAPPKCQSGKSLGAKFFAEGSTEANGEIYLLTWKEETGFVFDPATLMEKRRFKYEGEGWGLAWDGRNLWRSDGSSRLYPHQAGDFAPAGEPLTVRDEGREVAYLNELEWDPLTGLMLANVYGQDLVAAINLKNGEIVFWLDGRPLRGLAEKAGLTDTGQPFDTVLNGLALSKDGLWLTGKLWPRLYLAVWPPEEAKELLKTADIPKLGN